MRALRSTRALMLSAVALVVGGLVGAGVAFATHVPGSQPAEVLITRTVDTDGVDSGWHTHPGPVIVQVESGKFKFFQGTCQPTVVHSGGTFIEVPNLPIRAVSTGAITWTTTLIIPDSAAPRTNVASPCG